MNRVPDHTVIGYIVVTAAVALFIMACTVVFTWSIGYTWVRGIQSFLPDGQSSHAINCEQGEARG
jgi:hypothetical protein